MDFLFLYRLWHRDEVVYQIAMRHRSKSLVSTVIFTISGLGRFHSVPCGFVRFHYTTTFFGILPWFNFRLRSHLRDAIWWSFTRHGSGHRSFQFSSRTFENFFVVFVIWIGKVKSSQSSSIVELWFLFCRLLFFSILSGFTNFRPHFCHTWSGLAVAGIFFWVSSWTTYIPL